MANLEKIKETALMLMYAVPLEPLPQMPIFVSHPFTNSSAIMIKGEDGKPQLVDLFASEENKELFYRQVTESVNRMISFDSIWTYMNKPYRLVFLKYCKPYLTKDEFSSSLGEIWVDVENPNNDVNVTLEEISKWFKEANKKALMDEEDYEVYASLPEEFDVYRGVSVGRNPKGFSWTRDYNVAKKFANRFGKGYILKAHITKDQVLAYFNARGEDEYVVDTNKLKDIERSTL